MKTILLVGRAIVHMSADNIAVLPRKGGEGEQDKLYFFRLPVPYLLSGELDWGESLATVGLVAEACLDLAMTQIEEGLEVGSIKISSDTIGTRSTGA